jgi:hypothetical protein
MIQELIETECHFPLDKGNYYIYDDNINNKPLFVNETEKWNLNIINCSNKQVNFFQNDGCLMKQNELKKCDWFCIFENNLYFIEAKDVKMKKRNIERKDAVEKFEANIPYFLNLYPNIKTMKIFVIVNFRSPKITSASDKARSTFFDEKYNAKYKETNRLEFN